MKKLLGMALEAGSEVVLVLRGGSDGRLTGRVQALDDEFVQLYFVGSGDGWLWAVRLADVAACALLVPSPQPVCAHHPNRSF
ncbi:MAG: hypothetical protein JWM80_3998 [Cyanobacteria bacterium RYN_339]|nr:hypothetical protein [Cyanobacteria bacterium RYN_339]